MGCIVAGAAWLGWTWVGYPAWLAARSLVAPRPVRADHDHEGSVAIVIVARNEAHQIGARLAELRTLDLPERTTLHLVVVDDGSHDDTSNLALAAATQAGPRVDLVRQAAAGKAVGLAAGVERTDADIIVFADVRQRIPPDALTFLLAPFADPSVGVVSGVVKKPARGAPGLYWAYESLVRRLESRTGSTIGATGPWYAIRRKLFVAPPPELILDDVWVPMQAVFAGARAVVAERACVHDVEHPLATEHAKKSRTLTGNLQLIEWWPELLDPRANPVWARFVSHKLMRLLTPTPSNVTAFARWLRRDYRWA